tara:strand:+ start:328 stop:711 length:384 start_codon:yes stop_codon:yes gene_type:complete
MYQFRLIAIAILVKLNYGFLTDEIMSTGVADEKAIDSLKALAEPIRLKIIESLSSGEKCVCDLMEETGLAQSKISFHLKVLKEAGVITDRQSGRWVYYELDTKSLKSLQNWIKRLRKGCSNEVSPCE